jgi:hypothetical protein
MTGRNAMKSIPSLKRFQRGDRLYVQAQQIWLILVAFVMSRSKDARKRTTTYGEVARAMGYPDAQAGHMLGRQLGIVGKLCALNDLPTLNSIVVTKSTNAPGHEVFLRKGRTVAQEQSDVLEFDWYSVRVPTTGTFRKVWELND